MKGRLAPSSNTFTTSSLRPAQQAAKAAQAAADAAKLNAQAVIDAERAHLYVTVVQHNVSDKIQAANQARHDPRFEKIAMHAPVLAYVFKNASKIPAILEEVMHSMMIEKTEKHTITYEAPDRALEIILGESDLNDRIAVTFDERPFLFEDAKALGDHDSMLFFYSAATYRDIYNPQHKIRHDFLYSADRFHLINRIEKTIEPQERGGTESEQTSRTARRVFVYAGAMCRSLLRRADPDCRNVTPSIWPMSKSMRAPSRDADFCSELGIQTNKPPLS